jgi:hypothetical protein
MTFWRQHYTLDGPVMRKGEELEKIKRFSEGKEVAKWLGFETSLYGVLPGPRIGRPGRRLLG